MKKALVTGGAGFIGSHLCDLLIRQNWAVQVVDDLSTGSMENVHHLMDNKDFDFTRGDIRDACLMARLTTDRDAIFHLAAMASVPLSMEKPLECHEINVTAFLNILTLARERKIPVVYASSAAVYGNAGEGHRKETDFPAPLSPYGASKIIDEAYATMASRTWGQPAVGLRFFNVYGPRQDPEGPYASVIPRFAKAILTKKPVKIYGDGEQTRDFVYVEDVARIMLRCAESAEKLSSNIFNIAGGRAISINNLYSHIANLAGMSRTPQYRPPRPGDIRHSLGDTSLAERYGLIEKRTDLQRGLKSTLAYYKSHTNHFD